MWGRAIRHSECHKGSSSESIAIYAPDFFLEDPEPWWIFPNFKEIKKSDLIQSLSDCMDLWGDPELIWQGPSKTDFQEHFADLQRRFERGELQKAVPVIFEKAFGPFAHRVRAGALKNLLTQVQSPHLHLYGIWSAQEGMIGATPELLFELNLQKTDLKTIALAGTRLKVDPLKSEAQGSVRFLEDPKERKEHQWVVDGISASLNQLAQDRMITREGDAFLEVGETQVLELPTLWHLLTPIRLKLRGSSHGSVPRSADDTPQFFMKIIHALHPTAALGAVPRPAGMHWLREQDQKFSRRRFGAPWGVVMPDGSIRCWVAIRNLQWDLEKLWFSAGCGVIAESRCEHEWAELQGKLHAVKKYFGWESRE
jgi:menaquinone-specific isochorismate synthase